jgi:putative transposase
MKRSRFTEYQILAILNEAETGVPITDLCRIHKTSSAMCDKSESRYGALDASELKRLKRLEAQLSQYKGPYAELLHENDALKEVSAKEL